MNRFVRPHPARVGHPRRLVRHTAWALACCLGFGAATAQATSYRCVENGVVRFSDKPCLAVELGKMGGFGPLAQAGEAPAPRAAKADKPQHPPKAPGKPPAWAAHLGGECGALRERIRLGPSQQVASGQLKEWRLQYRQQCAEAENLARQQAKLEKAKAKAEKPPKPPKARKGQEDAPPAPKLG